MAEDSRRARFRELHARQGIFVMPNAFDVGSARLLASLGCEALATTSARLCLDARPRRPAGDAGRAGRVMSTALAAATTLPLSVDSERVLCRRPRRGGRDRAAAGRGRCRGLLDRGLRPRPPTRSTRSARSRAGCAAAAAAHAGRRDGADGAGREPAARCRGPGRHDRQAAGLQGGGRRRGVRARADVDGGRSSAVVTEVDAPVNVLMLPGVPKVDELAELGVRRVSTGSAARQRRLRLDAAGGPRTARAGNHRICAQRDERRRASRGIRTR